MTGLRSTLVTSKDAPCSRSPHARRRLLLKAVPDGTPSRDAESGDAWSVRSVSGPGKDADCGASGCSKDDLVKDTLAAFRDTLRRADDAETPADVLGGKRTDAPSGDDLDYFTAAFRTVLRDEAPAKAPADTGCETEDCEGVEDPAPLAYFTPALP